MTTNTDDQVLSALDDFQVELPSWGFADTGTRFGKFRQPAAASTIEEKLADAGLVNRLTGACPSVAVHVLWDFRPGQAPKEVAELACEHGVRIGAINPNVFQDPAYKLGSFCSPDPAARKAALDHTLESIRIGRDTGSTLLSMWLADGTNYPGQDNVTRRKRYLQEAFRAIHDQMPDGMTLLVEYKPFEPGFYHTDLADWGMAYVVARHAGPNARVLVDTGHHLPGANVEHIVAFLLDEGMLGGFHFNDRKYADDDLTMGSIDPYAAFRIFNAIAQHEHDAGTRTDIAYMVDQSHNLKPKIEAMIQTVETAQILWAKAHLVNRARLAAAQDSGDIVTAERCLTDAFQTDVRPVLAEWRRRRGLPADPLAELRASGYVEKAAKARTEARAARGETQGTSYA
ncbi:MAG: L-rhamnose isomerase [Chthonomonadales bacterium]|nr:L-rhamnose isomerase [Chthonomonadales bacterium]